MYTGDGYSHAQPAQQWYPSDSSTPTRHTGYAPHTPNTSTVVGTHPGSPGYQHYPLQYSQHQEPSNQYQSPGFYQLQQSPPGPGAGTGGAGIAHSSQTQIPGTPAAGSSAQLAGSSGVVFSVGEGGAERKNLGASSNSVASASVMSAGNYHSGGRPVATSRVRSY